MSDGAERVVEAEGPGANVATLEAGLMDRRVRDLIGKLGDVHPAACCAGAAGAEIPVGRARLHDLLTRLLPNCRLSVVHDARLVLAAAALESGIALIAGTGSVAYGRTADGREAQRGGWGWMVGDDGGAVWITRKAAREVMGRSDAGGSLGPLGEALLSAAGARDTRQLTLNLHAMREPMQWAALATTVFDTAGFDEGSAAIVRRAASELAALVRDIQREVDLDGPIVLAGGLLLNQPLLERDLRAELGEPVVRLEAAPVEGAVRLAEELLRA